MCSGDCPDHSQAASPLELAREGGFLAPERSRSEAFPHLRLPSRKGGTVMMRRVGGVLLTVTGILFCPCHLIITLPLLASLLAGTALGSFLAHNTGLIVTFASLYFLGALALGYWLLF